MTASAPVNYFCATRPRWWLEGCQGRRCLAFILTLDTPPTTSIIGLGTNLRFFLRFVPSLKNVLFLRNHPSPHFALNHFSMATNQVPPAMYSVRSCTMISCSNSLTDRERRGVQSASRRFTPQRYTDCPACEPRSITCS